MVVKKNFIIQKISPCSGSLFPPFQPNFGRMAKSGRPTMYKQSVFKISVADGIFVNVFAYKYSLVFETGIIFSRILGSCDLLTTLWTLLTKNIAT